MRRIAIVSDIHYAGPREQSHGPDFEFDHTAPSLRRSLVRCYRHRFWMRDPTAHNAMLDTFIERARDADLIVANGDYTCDVAGVGVSDDEACESVQICLDKLRQQFDGRFHATIGDHELGKVSLLGDHGGLRLSSWERTKGRCGLLPFWRLEIGRYALLGVTSTLVGLPIFQSDVVASEWEEWNRLRDAHLREIGAAFEQLNRDQRLILFCHDPTALSFLLREEAVRQRLDQVACTIIGHLHTRLIFWKSRLLAGMPVIKRLGISVQRMTSALNQARSWAPFKPRLCPSLAGIELHKTGSFLTLDLDETGDAAPRFRLHRISRGIARQ